MTTSPALITSVEALRQFLAKVRLKGQTVALVPTMGAFHQGHLSLVRLANMHADCTVVSIYVNPTQFGPTEDLEAYPRDFQSDLEALEVLGVAAVFAPTDNLMYPRGFSTYVAVEQLTTGLCGSSRPTHFRGVTTVVTKLFNLVRPDVAVFGEKDYQQLAVIRRMTRDLNFDIDIIGGMTIREPDGLALSSRNAFLTESQRDAAPALYRALTTVRDRYRKGERNGRRLLDMAREIIEREAALRIDYIELIDPEDLHPLSQDEGGLLTDPVHMALAAFVGSIRLIDNMRISDTD